MTNSEAPCKTCSNLKSGRMGRVDEPNKTFDATTNKLLDVGAGVFFNSKRIKRVMHWVTLCTAADV